MPRRPYINNEQLTTDLCLDITYIVQHNANKDVERNAKEVHYGASSLLRNVLGPHLHDRRPENPHTGLKCAEATKLNTP